MVVQDVGVMVSLVILVIFLQQSWNYQGAPKFVISSFPILGLLLTVSAIYL